MSLATPGSTVYAPNANREDQAYEDCILMGFNPEMTAAMVDFGDDQDLVIVAIEELEPACEECGGMKKAGCCGDE